MTAYVQPDLVQATWQRVGALSPAAVLQLQNGAGKLQPEIVGFVIGFTAELRPDAVGLALYVMLVVLEMFRVAPVRKVVKVRDSTISRHWHANRQLLQALRDTGGTIVALPEAIPATVERNVLRYVVEALTEGDPEGGLTLSDDEAWHLAAVLKTAVDALHDGCRV